jgi:Leucine-rich repeat (LRR) protein
MTRPNWTVSWHTSLAFASIVAIGGCQPAATPVARQYAAPPPVEKEPQPLIRPEIALITPLPAPALAPAPESEPEPTPLAPVETPELPVIPEPEPEPIAASMQAAALSRLFQAADSSQADDLLGKRVELTGYILQVRNLGPQRLVVLGDEHFTADLPAERVLCHIEDDMTQAGAIASARLRVTGTCQLGYGKLVVLRNCKIEEELAAEVGFEERKLGFAASQNLAQIEKLGVLLEQEEGGLAANLDRTHFIEGQIKPEILRGLSEIKDLRTLRLSGLPISDHGLRQIPFLARLHEITLDSTRVSADGLAALATATELRRVTLDGTTLDEGFAHLAGATQLQSLKLQANQGRSEFSEVAVRRLSKIKSLTTLNLEGARLTPAVMTWIGQQQNLQSLSLEHTSLDAELLKELRDLSTLRSLSLSSSNLDDSGMLALASFPNLHSLDLSKTKITDSSLSILEMLTELKELDLSGCPIVGGGLGSLRGSKIESLSLWGTRADNEALMAIESITSLKKLRLGHTKITYAALSRLAPLQNLEHLELYGIRLDRTSLPILEGLPSLKVLRLSENPFDDCDACLGQLSQSRPGLNLYLGHYDYFVQTNTDAP